MLNGLNSPLFRNPEFQSALVRLGIWLFAVLYIGFGALTGYYVVDYTNYLLLFGGFLVLFLGLLLSIPYRPVWVARRYFSMLSDITATSLCIYLTKEVVSPFYLLYIWIFISYGTRYGKGLLNAASILSILAYSLVLIALGQWQRYTFEVIFFLLLLILLPFYQYILLRKLHEARLEAERSDRAKSVFLSCMTHELRTPLSGIAGMSQLLLNSKLSMEQREYADSIVASAQTLDSLISEALDLSTIDAGGIELKPQPLDIRALCGEVLLTLSHGAFDKGLELICRIDEQVPERACYDPLRLRQVLFNLLSNAVKFTRQGEVELMIRMAPASDEETSRGLLIEIRDTGIGLDSGQQGQLFERFWQADSSSTSNHGGIGLGTTITRRLIELMNGEIGVESSLGRGTLFRIRLPLTAGLEPDRAALEPPFQGMRGVICELNDCSRSAIHQACAELGVTCHAVSGMEQLSEVIAQIETQDALDFAIIADSPGGYDVYAIARLLRQHLNPNLPVIYLGYLARKLTDNHPASYFMAKPFTTPDLRTLLIRIGRERRSIPEPVVASNAARALGSRVLIAEDNAINAKVLRILLNDIGCHVSYAVNGEEALALAVAGDFDIAIIDLRMPKKDGLAFTRDYRQLEKGSPRLPIIALTANTSPETETACRDAGMDDCLAKPVAERSLRSVIEHYARRTASTGIGA